MQSGGRQSRQDMEPKILPSLSSSWLLQCLEVLWLSTDFCDPCSGMFAVGVLWAEGLCCWVSLGGLSEIKPRGRGNINFWQAEIPGL